MDTPNQVADAAELLAKFCQRDKIVERGPGPQLNDDDRAAVLGAQLLAIASQAERIADSQERIATSLEWIVSMFEEKAVAL